MPSTGLLPPQDIAPLEHDPDDERGPFDPPSTGKRFSLTWYLFFAYVAEFITEFVQPTVAPDYYTITPSAGNAVIDLSNGLTQLLVNTTSLATFLAPIWTGGTIAAGQSFWLYILQDSNDGNETPAFTGGAGGFASDTGSEGISPDPDTLTAIRFTFHGAIWIRDSWKTGLATS